MDSSCLLKLYIENEQRKIFSKNSGLFKNKNKDEVFNIEVT